MEDPKELWKSLNERYVYHKNVLLLKAHYDWTNLRFQDFKTVSDYNSTLFRIVSRGVSSVFGLVLGQNQTKQKLIRF